MRKFFASAVVAVIAMAGVSAAQPAPDDPPACQLDHTGNVDFEACAGAAAPGSPARRLSLINLGSQAYRRGDVAAAVRYYDEAEAGGQRVYADAEFHALRADAYRRVGRDEAALEDARLAYALVTHAPPPGLTPPDLWAKLVAAPADRELVYALILPILKAGGDPHFSVALTTFNALPAADWISYANRAALLMELGDLPNALDMNAHALALNPDHPQVLNSQCYILALAHRGAEALPYCQKAVSTAPNVAAVHDSYAAALADAGQCTQADAERAQARRLDPVSVEYSKPLVCAPAR